MSNRLVGSAVALVALLFAILLLWGSVSNEFSAAPPTAPLAKSPVVEATAAAEGEGTETLPDIEVAPEQQVSEDQTGVEVVAVDPGPVLETSDDAQLAQDEMPNNDTGTKLADAASDSSGDEDTAQRTLTAPAPEFDLLRVDPSGFALAAGRAAANTDVRIYVGDALITTARTDANGAFVAYFQTPPSEGAQPVRAETDSGPSDGPSSTEPLYILSSAAPDQAPIIVEPAPEGITVVQPAKRVANDAVSLDQITYDDAGRVTFAGRGEGLIILYLDNAKLAEAFTAGDGSWRTQAIEPIAPGVYALRVDQLGNGGVVTSRLETPFQREAITRGDVGKNALTVQAGNNLWRLAEQHYGSGARFTVIFDANRDAIRDPDLIYPGQIFVIPDEKRADIDAGAAD